jgi:cysteine synthase A
MGTKYDNILQTVGSTPVVRVRKLAPPGVNLYVKVEAFNPLGSIKDRLALGVIEDAEQTGELLPGQTVVEATSGNTGIGLAMVCAQKGYPLVITMAENFSVERRKLMRFLGAKVVLTPATQRGLGMLEKAIELAEAHGWFLCRQFENEANATMHSRTTAREILDDFEGDRLDYWVTGFGTGGTLKGVARVLKQQRSDTEIVVCEPDNSPLLGSGIAQRRTPAGAPAASHPSFRPHMMQGWSPDFIPKLTEDVVMMQLIDRILPVAGDDALRCSQDLAQKEGIFTGISGGATLAAALEVCRTAPDGANVLCMLPDTGERYLSTPLFEGIATEMTAEEHEISRSTPNYRFDVPIPAAPAQCAVGQEATVAEAEVTPEAVEFVEKTVLDPDQRVVMFALEWCEFCWSIRKLLSRFGISYRSVDLDSVEFQEDDWGGKVRAAVFERTDFKTIPQVFVGGEFVGGCVEVLDAFKQGRFQALLAEHAVSYDKDADVDVDAMLPSWLHSR